MEAIREKGARWEQVPALSAGERSKCGLQIKFALGSVHNYEIPEPKGFQHLSAIRALSNLPGDGTWSSNQLQLSLG